MSQFDLFSSQPLPSDGDGDDEKDSDRGDEISASCPIKLLSTFVMLFEWDETLPNPFKVFPFSKLDKQIKPAWIQNNLTPKSRQKKLKLNGKNMSLFGKMNSSKFIYTIIYKSMKEQLQQQ